MTTSLPSKILKISNLKSHLNPISLPEYAAAIANLILASNNRDTLKSTLHSQNEWNPNLVHQVFKHLWNHGPKALEFFDALDVHPSYSHTAMAFDYAIDIASRMQDYKRAWKLLRRMRSRKLGPSPKTFAILMERYVSAGKTDKAVKVFLSMHNNGCQQDLSSFNSMLDVFCKSKKADMAYRLFKILRGRFRADVISYNIIASGFCLKKQTAKALDVLREMAEKGLKPTLTTYNIMLKGFLSAGQINEAWQFFLQMKKRKVEIDVVSYTTLVHGFGVVGEVQRARKVFAEMNGAGVAPSIVTYNAMVQVLCKKDCVQNAVVIFGEMLRKGYIPNATTYNVLIRGLCHARKFDAAEEFMDKMQVNCKPTFQTFNIMIRYYCDEGEIDKAMEVFKKMSCETCLPNLDTYNVLIGAMFARRKPDDLVIAGKLLVEMVGRGFLPRRFTVNRVLNGLMVTCKQKFAQEILRELSESGRLPYHIRL